MRLFVSSPKYGDHYAIIDDDDYAKVKDFNWVLDLRRNSRKYARASYRVGVNKFKYHYLHRLVMNAPSGLQVDHIDNDGLNNSKTNLRIASHRQNLQNREKPISNTSRYKGVYLYKTGQFAGRYSVQVIVDNKRIWGGYFDTIKDAAIRYNELAAKHHGQFAHLNSVPNE